MSTLNLKIFEIHVCNQRKNRYYSAVQNLFHDCRRAALCPFTALRRVYGMGCPHSLLISKPLYCCMDACRWHHYLPFSSWLEFSLLYSADQAGAYRHGILCASRRYSRYHHSIPGRSEFNSHRHGCVDIGIALIVLPSSKTIGELTSYIISY